MGGREFGANNEELLVGAEVIGFFEESRVQGDTRLLREPVSERKDRQSPPK